MTVRSKTDIYVYQIQCLKKIRICLKVRLNQNIGITNLTNRRSSSLS